MWAGVFSKRNSIVPVLAMDVDARATERAIREEFQAKLRTDKTGLLNHWADGERRVQAIEERAHLMTKAGLSSQAPSISDYPELVDHNQRRAKQVTGEIGSPDGYAFAAPGTDMPPEKLNQLIEERRKLAFTLSELVEAANFYQAAQCSRRQGLPGR